MGRVGCLVGARCPRPAVRPPAAGRPIVDGSPARPQPPPRWVEGATAASGLAEGATSGSGQVEGVLVGVGVVEGGSSV